MAKGVPLTFRLAVTDSSKGCVPLVGAAVYIWHCDAEGRYSLYSDGVTGENYLRGVQQTDGAGMVTFTSTYPAAYPGRWPHAHFEVYPSLAKATSTENARATSQLALPESTCKLVYAQAAYGSSLATLAKSSLSTDRVFSDGVSHQLATMSGNVANGFVASLTFGV